MTSHDNHPPDRPLAADQPGASPRNASVPGVTSEKLLGARGELKIEHAGEIYSLRRTRNGKLILTK
jgi:hemin uptake protein HemP